MTQSADIAIEFIDKMRSKGYDDLRLKWNLLAAAGYTGPPDARYTLANELENRGYHTEAGWLKEGAQINDLAASLRQATEAERISIAG